MSYIEEFPDIMPHQKAFISKNPKKALLNWEMRVAKSLPACYWVDNPCRAGNTFIITLKQNKKDWIRLGTKATVLTKEEFKKIAHTIVNPTAIVVDEIHKFASPLFSKNRSGLAEALYSFVKRNPNCDFLGLSATMIRQDAWSLHTLLCYIGIYYDFRKWRDKFFELKYPNEPGYRFLKRPSYFPRDNWRTEIRQYVEAHTDIVSLKDIVEHLPPATITIDKVPPSKPFVVPEDKVITWHDVHTYEQQNKADFILTLGYRKLIVVVYYTAQIDELAEKLSKEKPVFVLDGRTKDADAVKRSAQEAEECYFIVQSSMGIGFDGYMFGAIVFASMAHSCAEHTQMIGRARHLKHLRPVFYHYLIGGKWDRRIKRTIDLGKNFNPHLYKHENLLDNIDDETDDDITGVDEETPEEGGGLWSNA
jgi:superfamily II DNA or RNA helicase